MEGTASRIITCLVGTIAGGLLSGLLQGGIAYFSNDKLDALLAALVFAILGTVVGALVGGIVGAAQVRFSLSLIIGFSTVVAAIFLFFSFAGGNDINTRDGVKGILGICLFAGIDAVIVSSTVYILTSRIARSLVKSETE